MKATHLKKLRSEVRQRRNDITRLWIAIDAQRKLSTDDLSKAHFNGVKGQINNEIDYIDKLLKMVEESIYEVENNGSTNHIRDIAIAILIFGALTLAIFYLNTVFMWV